MDAQAVCAADDKTLREMGIDTRGDIVALRVFCKCSPDKGQAQKGERDKKKKQLLSFLTSGGAYGEGPSRKVSRMSQDKKATEDNKKKRLELGWLHQFSDGDLYVNVRVKDGGGTRIIELPGNSRKTDIIAYAKKAFFSKWFKSYSFCR